MALRQTVLAGLLTVGLFHPAVGAEDQVLGDLQACLGGVSAEEAEALYEGLSARHEVLAAEHDLEARLDAACTAGDREEAEAIWATFEAELYAGPEEMLMRQCLEAQIEAMRAHFASLGMDVGEKPHVCEAEF